MRSIRAPFLLAALAGLVAALPGCGEVETGPVRVVAIGAPPALANPSREPLSPAAALLLDATAQGLVRFDAAGEIEPALAQSWIITDEGRRYTFRLRRTTWSGGEPVTARQVVERLQAVLTRNSRNPLRHILGSIERIEAMTDQVLEIRLRSPRANFLQLLAQPELALLNQGQGSGPYRIADSANGALRLVPPTPDDEEEGPDATTPHILLSGASAARAIAAFRNEAADFVTGGTLGDLPVLAAGDVAADRIVFDPAAGLFGLAFATAEGPLGTAPLRQALAMAIDREAIAARFAVPALQLRTSIVAPGVDELAAPAQPDWAAAPFDQRRERARAIVADTITGGPLRLRVAVPDGPGYRIVFAHLRRDWRMIGVEAVAVPAGAPAELRLVDHVAPAELGSWYLRPFICGQSAVCDEQASLMLEGARVAATPGERQALLAQADAALTNAAVFIPLGSPLRWHLRSERMNGFRANPFARHTPTELIQRRD